MSHDVIEISLGLNLRVCKHMRYAVCVFAVGADTGSEWYHSYVLYWKQQQHGSFIWNAMVDKKKNASKNIPGVGSKFNVFPIPNHSQTQNYGENR